MQSDAAQTIIDRLWAGRAAGVEACSELWRTKYNGTPRTYNDCLCPRYPADKSKNTDGADTDGGNTAACVTFEVIGNPANGITNVRVLSCLSIKQIRYH